VRKSVFLTSFILATVPCDFSISALAADFVFWFGSSLSRHGLTGHSPFHRSLQFHLVSGGSARQAPSFLWSQFCACSPTCVSCVLCAVDPVSAAAGIPSFRCMSSWSELPLWVLRCRCSALSCSSKPEAQRPVNCFECSGRLSLLKL
jgi:hypothetical protein